MMHVQVHAQPSYVFWLVAIFIAVLMTDQADVRSVFGKYHRLYWVLVLNLVVSSTMVAYWVGEVTIKYHM